MAMLPIGPVGAFPGLSPGTGASPAAHEACFFGAGYPSPWPGQVQSSFFDMSAEMTSPVSPMMNMVGQKEMQQRLLEMQRGWRATERYFQEQQVQASPASWSCLSDPLSEGSGRGGTRSDSSAAGTPFAGLEAPWAQHPHAQPVLGSAALPSEGSAGHNLGQCKPCAFMYKKGCTSGVECRYCHLCEVGEKRRRFKEKKAFFSALRQQ